MAICSAPPSCEHSFMTGLIARKTVRFGPNRNRSRRSKINTGFVLPRNDFNDVEIDRAGFRIPLQAVIAPLKRGWDFRVSRQDRRIHICKLESHFSQGFR